MKTEETNAGPAVLLQVTDPHLHADAARTMRGVNTYDSFLAVLEHVQRDPHWPPDAIIATGDLVQDESREGYERFRACLGSLGVPVYCIAGNHDDPALMAEVLSGAPFEIGGEARLGAWRLVMVDTYVQGEDGGKIGARGLAELDARLSTDRDSPTLLCMHHQPIDMGSAWLDGVGLSDAADLLALVEQHQQVRAIVWGHVHQASDRSRGELRLLSAPSTCAQFLPNSDSFALDDSPPGCRWIRLLADGRIETTLDWLPPKS